MTAGRIDPESRMGRLMIKLKEDHWQEGDTLRVGINSYQEIYQAASRLGIRISVAGTGETAFRYDGEEVPVWLVTFRFI
jgi:hypothetical protein